MEALWTGSIFFQESGVGVAEEWGKIWVGFWTGRENMEMGKGSSKGDREPRCE